MILTKKQKCKEIFFYEVIPAEKPCNLFFDLETSTKGWPETRWKAAVETVAEAIGKAFTSSTGIRLSPAVITSAVLCLTVSYDHDNHSY